MNVQDIIKNSLIEYDNTRSVIKYLHEKTDYWGTKAESEYTRTKMHFEDKETGKTILTTEVETLAIFYDKLNIWSWAWSHPGLLNSENYLAKEILIYSFKLGSELSYIKTILTTSRGVIKDRMQIDINLAISSSIIKQPYIFPYVYPVDGHELVYFLILLNDEDLNKLKEQINNEAKETNTGYIARP